MTIGTNKYILRTWQNDFTIPDANNPFWENGGFEDAINGLFRLLSKMNDYKFEELVKIVVEKKYG